MTPRKIALAAMTAMLMTGIASPAFADGDIDGVETIFETDATPQIEPVSLPQTYTQTQPKTIAEEAFDLTDGR